MFRNENIQPILTVWYIFFRYYMWVSVCAFLYIFMNIHTYFTLVELCINLYIVLKSAFFDNITIYCKHYALLTKNIHVLYFKMNF